MKVHGEHEKWPVSKTHPQIDSSRKTNLKRWALFYIQKVNSFMLCYIWFSQSVMLLKVQDRTEWTTGMLRLHKQGWIAWHMAQSMNNGNSISCDKSSIKCGVKSTLLVPPGSGLLFPLSMPYTISWEKKFSSWSYFSLLVLLFPLQLLLFLLIFPFPSPSSPHPSLFFSFFFFSKEFPLKQWLCEGGIISFYCVKFLRETCGRLMNICDNVCECNNLFTVLGNTSDKLTFFM